jgi:hypothetical protein
VHSCAVDVAELVFAEAVQLVLVEAATAEEVCEDEREDRVAVVVLAIDLLAALGEVPSAANERAIPSPIPDAAPVTSAIFP